MEEASTHGKASIFFLDRYQTMATSLLIGYQFALVSVYISLTIKPKMN